MTVTSCRCPGERPVTIATFRNAALINVIRHHIRPCPIPDGELDRVNWQPREPGPVLVHSQAPKVWWADRAEARHQDKRPPRRGAVAPAATGAY